MDSSWVFTGENKENNNPKCNESFNASFTHCVSTTNMLNVTNANMSGLLNLLSVNDSFDAEKMKMDVYEKSIQKLAAENKSLRKRVKKLTELARAKEEQLIEAFSEACDGKRKIEEKNQLEHNSQLQSYYECFLQIEKENDALKLRLEEMKAKMSEQAVALESLKQSQEEVDKEEAEKEREANLNKLSMEHIVKEMSSAKETVAQFISEQKTAQKFEEERREMTREEFETLRHQFDELELEKSTLEKKLASIEASLARWIFRACDHKVDLNKLEVKCAQQESKIESLSHENASLRAERESAIELSRLNQANFDAMTLMLSQKSNEIEKLNDLKLVSENEKVKLEEALKSFTMKIKVDRSVQTDLKATNESGSQTLKSQTESQTQTESIGHVAKTAAMFNSKKLTDQTPQTTTTTNETELKLVKLKLDQMTLEKNALKCKNDELTREFAGRKVDICVASVQTLKITTNEANTQTNGEWKARFDSYRLELEQARRELEETRENSNAQIDALKEKNAVLEEEIKSGEERLAKLTLTNQSLSEKVSRFDELENTVVKLNNDFKKEKQISDTIIQQQKKLLYFLQMKLNPDSAELIQHSATGGSNNHYHLASKLFKRNKNQNPLLANLTKPAAPYRPKPSSKAISEIQAELNHSYSAYSEMNRARRPPQLPAPTPATLAAKKSSKKTQQIHVFITGLNTCPVYCHVCQHLIPLIAYASKCQLCSFTCHSTCSNLSKKASQDDSPLKYCHTNYLKISHSYNAYINKLSAPLNLSSDKSQNYLLADYLFVYLDNKWRRYWLVLRPDALLELYQTKANHKPFDTLNLVADKIQFESDRRVIKKILSAHSVSAASAPNNNNNNNNNNDELNLYEQVEHLAVNFENSSLVLIAYNNKTCLQIGFTSFGRKNIWHDALQSALLVGVSASKKHSSLTTLNPAEPSFKCLNLDKVLKPFLELCDTIVNSYSFISESLIALACDDGLYVLNLTNAEPNASPNISLVKVNTIESAHKLYYQAEFGKLCLIGRKSRQFLSIDIAELASATIAMANMPLTTSSIKRQEEDEDDYATDEDEDKSINVRIEHIQNIDRCHLFECSFHSNGHWYLAVATPETIFILLYNKTTSKYTLIKTITTQSDSPCLCLKFSQITNQLIFGCSKEFFKMDMTYLQSTPVLENLGKKVEEELGLNKQRQPIAVCAINQSDQEAVLLCYEDLALVLALNQATMTWQVQQANQSKKSSSSSSINSSSTNGYSCLKWPLNQPPLQIKYDSGNLYLFYNDSIIIYSVSYERSEAVFVFRKLGCAFIYKPRYLGVLHTGYANCLILSNRSAFPYQAGDNESQLSHNESNPYYEFEEGGNDEDEDDAQVNNGKVLTHEDRICLSYFSPFSA